MGTIDLSFFDRACARCRGTGQMGCGACACPGCGATGEGRCGTCTAGALRCEACLGTARQRGFGMGHPCVVCEGRGTVPCPTCGGRFQWTCSECAGAGRRLTCDVCRCTRCRGGGRERPGPDALFQRAHADAVLAHGLPSSSPSACRRLQDVTAPWFHADANGLFRVGESLSSLLALLLELHGRASAELSHPDEVPALERSVRLDPSRPTALWALGNAYAALERWPEAVTAFQTVFRAVSAHQFGVESLGGHFPELHGCFATALAVVGRNRDAAAVLAQGMLAGACDEHSIQTLGRILEADERGDLSSTVRTIGESGALTDHVREHLGAIVFELASPEVSEVLGVEGDPSALPAAPFAIARSIRLEHPAKSEATAGDADSVGRAGASDAPRRAPISTVGDPESAPTEGVLCSDPED